MTRPLLFLLFTIFSLSTALAETSLTYVEHENPGCPENSLCSKNTGILRGRWLEEIKELKLKKTTSKEQINTFRRFFQQHGLPIPHWGAADSFQRYPVILWESSCPRHQSKELKDKIFEGISFIKGTKDGQAMVVGQTQIEKKAAKNITTSESFLIPLGELLALDPVDVSSNSATTVVHYDVPRGETPLYMEKDKLIFVREDEGLFYGLSIAKNGTWEIVQPDLELSKLPLKNEVKCPESLAKLTLGPWPKKLYQDTYCINLFDKTTQTQKIMRIAWSCP